MTAAGGSYCWGKLRDAGDASDLPVPARTPGGVGFAQVFAGNEYACGLTQAAEADCWGANATGVLGNGTKAYRAIPTRVVGNLRFSSLATAAFHACGLTLDGAAYCWGSNGFTPALKSFYDFVAANYTAVDSIGPMKWTVYRRRTSAFAPLHP
jgi:alpha-tubulin suppressor-like RCC1 family protein